MPDSRAANPFPPPIRHFVRHHIPSLHQLEILLCVYTPPLRAWQPDTIATQLYLPLELVVERLVDLADRGLIQADTSTSPAAYSADATQAPLIDQLATCYKQQRIALTTFIFTQPNDVVQSFADAFKLRKES